ncbi:MAG TPA: hypothetical protein VGU44_05895, partial [Gammaproteobacteria bacterium]|nr:hypothetical protein [Gammaproteobacteria bacterium]
GTDDSCQHEGEVTALGNAFVSWEYVDARYSAEANGEFTIPKSQELFRTVLKDDLAFQGSNVETKDDLVFHLAELQKALSPRDLSPDAPLNREKGNIPRPLTPILNSMNVVENSSHFGVTQGPNTREYLCTRGSAEP